MLSLRRSHVQFLVLALALFAVAIPAAAQKVYVDYDKEADLESYKSFAWLETKDTRVGDPLAHSVIKNTLEHYLTAGGLVEDHQNPDLYVTYHGDEKTEYSVNSTSFGYGYGGGWYNDPFWGPYGGSMGSTTSSVSSYQRGTLVIDLYDAEKKQVVWRGKAVATIPQNPSKATRQIEKAIDKMVKKWDKMKKKM